MHTSTGCTRATSSLYFPCINSEWGVKSQPEIGVAKIVQNLQSDSRAGRPQPFTKRSQSGGVPLRLRTRPRHETVGRNDFTTRTRARAHSDFSKRTRAAAAALELAATGS